MRVLFSCVGVLGLEVFFFKADFNGTALNFGSFAGISSTRVVSMLGFGVGYDINSSSESNSSSSVRGMRENLLKNVRKKIKKIFYHRNRDARDQAQLAREDAQKSMLDWELRTWVGVEWVQCRKYELEALEVHNFLDLNEPSCPDVMTCSHRSIADSFDYC
jgi:hypothetical protein